MNQPTNIQPRNYIGVDVYQQPKRTPAPQPFDLDRFVHRFIGAGVAIYLIALLLGVI